MLAKDCSAKMSSLIQEVMEMQSKEVKNWRHDEALERYKMIAPLLDPEIDDAKRCMLREQIASREGKSVRTLYRYEKQYAEEQFAGLIPKNREKRRSQKLPENWDEIVAEAVQLRKEVPKRSVRQIIVILESEDYAPPGVIKASTLQRYLQNAGMSKKALKRYTEDKQTSSRKFCKAHRLELYQGDIKYGPIIRDKDGNKIQTYLSSTIDDHSRLITQSEWYDNQREEIVEETVHKAVLKHGVFDSFYVDNGSQYISKYLSAACARLGIRVLHAPPFSGKSKGKVERFHQTVDSFIAELAVDPVHSIAEMNEKWKYFLEEDYQKRAHSGIAEYYRSKGIDLPKGGITPIQEWNRDNRRLKYLDSGTVADAFTRHETREIDKTGCFEFNGITYEASVAYSGLKVEIAYDPLNTNTIEVRHGKLDVIHAHPIDIGPFAKKEPVLPAGMADVKPETSRLLDALEKKYKENHNMMANALSFGDYGKAGE